MTPLARLDIRSHAGAVVARVEGDIDLSNAHELRSALEASVPADAVGLIVDLSGAGYLDSSGIAVLVGVARELTVRRQRLAVVSPEGSATRRVLEIVQVGEVADLHTTIEAATEALAAR